MRKIGELDKKTYLALVKAHNHGFMQGACIMLNTLGRDWDMPTLAKNMAIGHGIGNIKDFKGHGIDPQDLEILKDILKG